MAVNPLTDFLSHPADYDDYDDEPMILKRKFVEEEENNHKQGGKRNYCIDEDDEEAAVIKREIVEEEKQCTSKYYVMMKNKKKTKTSPSKSKKHSSNRIYGPRQVKSPAMLQAEDVRSSLGTESPSFLKLVVPSHVEGSFSMSLPGSFCRSHLPINNTVIILEDEREERFEVKYFSKWMGLSGGWRNFAVQHKLREGDVLVFHLVAPTRFKVYIVRANDYSESDGTPRSRLDLDTHEKQNEPGENLGYDNNEETVCKGLETMEDFNIMLNGLGLEYSDLHENMRKKFYELCCSTNAILHDGLLPGLNSKLIAGVISGTVTIADVIKACNFSTSRDELEQWEKLLKSFDLLGMNVGFLLNRLSQLLRLVFKSKRASFEDKIKNLEVKRVELKEAYGKIDGDIEKLKSKAERQHLKLRELVNAPW
ncbi:hypothetical protein LguiB_009256 [Lonicera macranthoides]